MRQEGQKQDDNQISSTKKQGEGQIPPSIKKSISQDPYADVFVLDDTYETNLFMKRYYNVAIAIEFSSSGMRPVCCASDSGAGPNLLPQHKAEPGWMSSIYVSKQPQPRRLTNQTVEVVDKVIL